MNMNNQSFEYWSNVGQVSSRMIERCMRESMEMSSDCLATIVRGGQELASARKIEDAVQAQTKMFAEISAKIMNNSQQCLENFMECASAGRKWFDGMMHNCAQAMPMGQSCHNSAGSGKSKSQ